MYCSFRRCPEGCECTGLALLCNTTGSLLLINNINVDTVRMIQLYNVEIVPNTCLPKSNQLVILTLSDVSFKSVHIRYFSKYLRSVMYLFLDKITFTNTAKMFSNMTSLLSINITRCQLNYLQAETFAGLVNIKTLDLSGSHIYNIDRGAFCDLYNLTLLNLESNNITKLHRYYFLCLNKIKVLKLSHNPMYVVESMIPAAILYVSNPAVCCYLQTQSSCVVQNVKMHGRRTCPLLLTDCLICKTSTWILAVCIIALNGVVITYRVYALCRRKHKDDLNILLVAVGDISIGIYFALILLSTWIFSSNILTRLPHLHSGRMCQLLGLFPLVGILVPTMNLALLTVKQFVAVRYSMSRNIIIDNLWTAERVSLFVCFVVMVTILGVYLSNPCMEHTLCFQLYESDRWRQIQAYLYVCVCPCVTLILRLYVYVCLFRFAQSTSKIKNEELRKQTNMKILRRLISLTTLHSGTWLCLLFLVMYHVAIDPDVTTIAHRLVHVTCLSVSALSNPFAYSLSVIKHSSGR